MLFNLVRPVRIAIIAAAVFLTACSTVDGYRDDYPQPDERLNHILWLFEQQRESGNDCHELWHPSNEVVDCGRLLYELDKLYADFPHHSRVMMANAVYNYKAERKDKAQLALDQLLNHGGSHPEAAILRAKIALEEGNSTLAEQVLKRELMLAPSRSDLRSAIASVYFANGEYEKSRNVLSVQGLDNSSPWQVSYHFGLLAEAESDWDGACRYYQRSLEQQSGYAPAMARLIGLSEYISCPVYGGMASGETDSYDEVENTVVETVSAYADAVSEPLVLSDISLSASYGATTVLFGIPGQVPGIRALQIANPAQVIVDIPGAINQLDWENTNFDDDYVKQISIEELDDRVRVRIGLRNSVDVQLKNDPGNIRVMLLGQ